MCSSIEWKRNCECEHNYPLKSVICSPLLPRYPGVDAFNFDSLTIFAIRKYHLLINTHKAFAIYTIPVYRCVYIWFLLKTQNIVQVWTRVNAFPPFLFLAFFISLPLRSLASAHYLSPSLPFISFICIYYTFISKNNRLLLIHIHTHYTSYVSIQSTITHHLKTPNHLNT